MRRWDITLVLWFFVLALIVFINPWWFPLAWQWKVTSIVGAFVGSFFLLLNYNIKTYGTSIFGKDNNRFLSDREQLAVADILKSNLSFRRTMCLLSLVALAYLVATVAGIGRVTTRTELYLYVTGWAVICLIFDLQIRVHLMCNLLKKMLSRS
ncbi:MAG: hypothetical protein HY537_14735 [Deltaproteobacteria bacterium]|nr:hypothetical protein [Deltaproteobacteria bacterium]